MLITGRPLHPYQSASPKAAELFSILHLQFMPTSEDCLEHLFVSFFSTTWRLICTQIFNPFVFGELSISFRVLKAQCIHTLLHHVSLAE